jgi:integrase
MVPITPDLRPTFLSYLFTRPSTSDHLLLGTVPNRDESSGPLKTTGIRQILRRRCKRAGIEHLSPHTWRHGFAIFLRNNGTDLSDIAAAMGHTTTQVTQLYYAFTLAPAVHKAYDRALERMKDEE